MLQSKRGMVVVVGGGALLGLALALGYVFYWAPKIKADGARAEIQEWGDNWSKARHCLLGDPPRAADPTRAILARELSERGVKRALEACTGMLLDLRRSEGGSSDNEAIEVAWYALRIPVARLAKELAWRTARTPNKNNTKLRRNLGEAIVELDASYALIRQSAGMKKVPIAGVSLPKLKPYLTLRGPEGEKTSIRAVSLRASALTYTAEGDEIIARAKLSAGSSKPVFKRLSRLALRAVDEDWGLWLEVDDIPVISHEAGEGAKLVAGPLDAEGEPAGDGTLLHTLARGEQVSLNYASGQDKRTALYQLVSQKSDGTVSWAYRLFFSEDAGATFDERPLPTGEMWNSLRETGDDSYIISTDPADPMTLMLMTVSKSGLSEQRITFPGARASEDTWPPDQCMASTRLWWVFHETLFTMGLDGLLVSLPGKVEGDTSNHRYELLCGEKHAAIQAQLYAGAERSLHFQACTLDGCKEAIETASHTGDVQLNYAFHRGVWHTIEQLDSLIAISRSGDSATPKEFYHLESEGTLKGVVSWEDKLVFMVWPDDAPSPTLMRAE